MTGAPSVPARRKLGPVVLVLLCLWGAGMVSAPPVAAQCPAANPTYNGPCGPTFTLPYWGDAGGWKYGDQYSTIQLADVLGTGRDQLLGRSAAGIEIFVFDTTYGQWRPAVDAKGKPMILTAFADPPSLTQDNPNPPATDWTEVPYFTTIQTADLLGTGRDQIIARSSAGVLVYSYTPGANGTVGTWVETRSGAFNDEPSASPLFYPTVGTAKLLGPQSPPLVYGIDAGFSLRAVQWQPLEVLAPKGGIPPSFPPGVQAHTLQASPPIDGQQELFYSAPEGMRGIRLTYYQGEYYWGGTHSDSPGPFRFDSAAPAPNTPWDQWNYAQTIRFANVSGGSDVVLVGRGIDGLEAYRLTADSNWQKLATLTELSDAAGFNQEKYWQTITYADIDGSGQQSVLARGPNGLVAYQYDLASNRWYRMPGSISLTDDPWGTDESYYGTFRAGDAAGSGHEDTLIARGPFGIRTWFYDRPGQAGWGPYIPREYPDFTGNEKAAYDALNALAKGDPLQGDETEIRQIWTKVPEPDADRLNRLPAQLIALGRCTTVQGKLPPANQACSAPAGSSFTSGDWTDMINALLVEASAAEDVREFYAEIDGARGDLLIGQGADLAAVGHQLGLDSVVNTPASFNFDGVAAGAEGIAASVLYSQPELSAGLWVASAITSMIPSASSTFESTFDGTYSQLQTAWAAGIADADVASDSQNFQVRTDLNLLRMVSELRQRGTWDFDTTGFKSVGAQAFTQWVYKSLLPSIYARYSITSCQSGLFAKGLINACTGPAAGPWADIKDDLASDFDVVDAVIQPGSPCHEHNQGLAIDCAFPGADPAVVDTVSSPLSEACAYDPNNVGPAWRFGSCTLGIPADLILDPPGLFTSAKHNWGLRNYTGDPIPGLALAGPTAAAPARSPRARGPWSGARGAARRACTSPAGSAAPPAGACAARASRSTACWHSPAAGARSCTAP